MISIHRALNFEDQKKNVYHFFVRFRDTASPYEFNSNLSSLVQMWVSKML